MIDLSLIVVSWNAKEFLRKCVASIIRETGNYRTEILVVDNASTDGSAGLIRDTFPEVELLLNDANLGFAAANNRGIMRSRGTYILLINSDVEVSDGCIDRMVSFMDQHPNVGMLGPQILDADGNVQRSCMGFPTLWNTFCRALAMDRIFPKAKLFGGFLMTFRQQNAVRKVDVVNGCFWMVRREALQKVGLLDERFFIYAEDIDWCKRFWDAGWEVVYFPHARSVHYGGASSSHAPIRFSLEMLRANQHYWAKHHNRPAQAAFLVITGIHYLIRLVGAFVLYLIKPETRTSAQFKIKRSIACMQWVAGFRR
jgi:GT2 family glycosyltransferase